MASSDAFQERLSAALAHRYRIDREIGSGGMATVYLAEDLRHHRMVALKVLKPDLAEALGSARFLREIEVAANLLHPHILPVFDSGEADGFLFYVMPYVRGGSLRDRLQEEKQLPVDEAISIAEEVADALAHAHERDVIHRDVKPANILLSGGHALLSDFGVAQAVAHAEHPRLTQTGTSLGTPAYMSPEQAVGERDLDGRSDQYALGCVLYEMLAGQPPFTGAQVESVMRQHLTASPLEVTQLRPTVPSGVTELVTKALSKAPADRFPTTGEFGKALSALLKTPSGGVPATPRASNWGASVMKAGAVVGAAAALLLAWKAWVGEEVPVVPAGPPPWTILAEVEGSAPEELRSTVRSLLAGDIGATGLVRLLSDAEVRRGMAQAMMPDTTRLTSRVAREIAARGRISAVFAPELDRLGERYALTVQVLHAEGDSVIQTERSIAAEENDLIMASRAVVDSLGPALAAWAGGRVPRRRATPPITPSLEAFQKSQEANSARRRGQYEEAIRLAREALGIDPEFAEAWQVMAMAFRDGGFYDSANYARREALKYPERLSETAIETLDAQLAGDSVALFRIRERQYLEAGVAGNVYAVPLADVMDRYEDAVEVFQQAEGQSVFGIGSISYWNWASYLLALGRVEEAKAVADSLGGTPRELPIQAKIAVRDERWQDAERFGLDMARDPSRAWEWRSDGLWMIASARAARGRVAESLSTLREMIDLNQNAGRDYAHRQSQLNLLILTMAAELDPQPWRVEGLENDQESELRARLISGLWAAEVGDSAEARSYLELVPPNDLTEFDLPTSQHALVAALNARIAGTRKDWEEVIRLLEPLTEARSPRPNALTQLPNWIVAEAKEELGLLESAAHMYDWIAAGNRMGYDEVMGYGLSYSFAHRKAALLNGQLGERDKAIEHWRAFLDAFSQPDPEFEWMVEEGRAELARLER